MSDERVTAREREVRWLLATFKHTRDINAAARPVPDDEGEDGHADLLRDAPECQPGCERTALAMERILADLKARAPQRSTLLHNAYLGSPANHARLTPKLLAEARKTLALVSAQLPAKLVYPPIDPYWAAEVLGEELPDEVAWADCRLCGERFHRDLGMSDYCSDDCAVEGLRRATDADAPPADDAAADPESEDDGELTEDDVWQMLGGRRQALASAVATYVHSDDPAARTAAWMKIERYREKASEGEWTGMAVTSYNDEIPFGPPRESRRAEALGRYGDLRAKRRRGKQRDTTGALRIEKPGERERWDDLANDEPAIRAFLTAEAATLGSTLDELARPFTRGRQRPDELKRRDTLSLVVAAARDRGARLEAIGRTLGFDKRRVAELEARGRDSQPPH